MIFKILAVEWEHVEEGEEELIHFMKRSGFVKFGRISTTYASDLIFVRDFLPYLLLTVSITNSLSIRFVL